ncbi:helix-turn-helix domain-containing protein [Undibacterium sp. Ji67W]|uniref:helix-turn-helix domain-containing protein n=1 Tax=Undibacterium sp. Ji67W TaxID=3413042 RepID=UPI003BEFA265
MKVWEEVSKLLGVKPVVSAEIGTRSDDGIALRAERYLFRMTQRQIPALPAMVLLLHLGGGRAHEGHQPEAGFDSIPSFSAAMQANCPTEWLFGGAIDVAIFYFLEPYSSDAIRLQNLISSTPTLYPFNDALVNALARQIVDELSKGRAADENYLTRLSALMVEQSCRTIEGMTGKGMRPDSLQIGRLETVLSWIQKNLSAELPIAELAQRAGVSAPHFRRLFLQAMGVTPHRYVLQLRLQRASELLTRTDFSIERIAQDCGFSSQSHLTASFKTAFGVTPARMKQKARLSQFSE